MTVVTLILRYLGLFCLLAGCTVSCSDEPAEIVAQTPSQTTPTTPTTTPQPTPTPEPVAVPEQSSDPAPVVEIEPAGQCLRRESSYQATDISEALKSGLVPRYQLRSVYTQYPKLLTYYQDRLEDFAALYPEGLFTVDPGKVLEAFDGTITFGWSEVHVLPFQPLAVVLFDENEMAFSSWTGSCGQTTVPGLLFESRVKPLYKEEPDYLIEDFAYISDLNARALGFTHARLIRELSSNVAPAPKYYYNGLHEWSAHPKGLAADDQFDKVITLDNNAHRVGEVFAISPHPNFSLSQVEATAPTILTAFLWKAAPADPAGAPDFVYRIVLQPLR